MVVSAAQSAADYSPPLTAMPLPDALGVRPAALLAAAALYSALLAAACFSLPIAPAQPWPESEATFQLVLLQPAAAPADPEPSPVVPATVAEPPAPSTAPDSSLSLPEAPVIAEAAPEQTEPPVAEVATLPPMPRATKARQTAVRSPAHRAPAPSASPAPSVTASGAPQLTMLPPETEVPPRPIGTAAGNAKPEYPAEARQRAWQGRVVLRVEVSSAGEPLTVNVRVSSGHAVLDQAALRAIEAWRFVPATRSGTAVAGSVDVPVQFRLED